MNHSEPFSSPFNTVLSDWMALFEFSLTSFTKSEANWGGNVMMEGIAVSLAVLVLLRALYWFMIMAAGLCLGARRSLTKLCHPLLVPPPSAHRVRRAWHWKTGSISPEDVESQAFSSWLWTGALFLSVLEFDGAFCLTLRVVVFMSNISVPQTAFCWSCRLKTFGETGSKIVLFCVSFLLS